MNNYTVDNVWMCALRNFPSFTFDNAAITILYVAYKYIGGT